MIEDVEPKIVQSTSNTITSPGTKRKLDEATNSSSDPTTTATTTTETVVMETTARTVAVKDSSADTGVENKSTERKKF